MMPRVVSLVVLAVLIACLGLAFIKVVFPFLLPLALAGVVSLLCQPLFRYFLKKTFGSRAWAAALTSTAILTGVMLPVLICTFMAAWQLYSWSSELFHSAQSRDNTSKLYQELRVKRLVERLQPYLAEDVQPEELEEQITSNVRSNLPNLLRALAERTLGIAASTFGMVGTLIAISVGIGMFVTALYFFLADGPLLLAAAQDLLPLHRAYQDRMLIQFVRVTRAVVIGTFASALTQGLATGLGLYIAGINNVILLTILATLVAIVPMTGTWFIWIPCAAWMTVTREYSTTAVVTFIAYNLMIVGSLDNLIRAYILNSDVKLHPLLAFISVLGGLQWIGLWGVFVGPVIASCLHALIQIFNQELVSFGQSTPNTPEHPLPSTTFIASASSSVASETGVATPDKPAILAAAENSNPKPTAAPLPTTSAPLPRALSTPLLTNRKKGKRRS